MRVTLDLDNMNRRKAKQIFKVVQFIYPHATKFQFWKSSSGKGFHIVVFGAYDLMDEIKFRQMLKDRWMLSDDIKRIHNDWLRVQCSMPFNILFTQKGDKKSELVEEVITQNDYE